LIKKKHQSKKKWRNMKGRTPSKVETIILKNKKEKNALAQI
jgi:hypothetical protein